MRKSQIANAALPKHLGFSRIDDTGNLDEVVFEHGHEIYTKSFAGGGAKAQPNSRVGIRGETREQLTF